MSTVNETIKSLEASKPDTTAAELATLRMIPSDLRAPTVSNIRDVPDDVCGTSAWLSWRSSYGDSPTMAADTLAALESAGWRLAPATLMKKDNYRPSPQLGLFDSFGETYGRYTVTELWPLFPAWIIPYQHIGNEMICFMYAPDGCGFRVCIDLPRGLCSLSARRVEFLGGWRYEWPACLHYPPAWEDIHNAAGESIASRSEKSGARVESEQYLTGELYWSPNIEQDELTMTASEFVRVLMATK